MVNNRNSFFDLSIVDIDNNQISQNEVSLARWIFNATLLIFSEGESCNLQKEFEISEYHFRFIPDLYFEKGCKALGLQGRTIIELKSNLLLDTEIDQVGVYSYLIDNNFVDSIILVYIKSPNREISSAYFSNKIKLIEANTLIEEIKQAIKEKKGDVIKLLNTEEERWIILRRARLANAINDYKRYNSVLFLGAGVSASAKLPNWNELLKKLFGNNGCINANDYEDVYREMDYSNLMVARYVQKKLNIANSREMISLLRKEFYPRNRQVSSELISAICNMIINQDKVRSIITYNYDTHLETNLKLKGKRCFSIFKKNHDESASFPVYHVHGVIFPENSKDESGGIVLSESDYHRKYSEVYDWSNVEQLHALSRCCCFFIGLSMKDPNLRRLLEIAKEGSGTTNRHYVFLERESFTDDADKCEKDFQIREDLLADLGLNVIWYKGGDNHKELPELLKLFIKD